jgi:hypothetical protein
MNTKPLTVRFARDGKWIQAYCLVSETKRKVTFGS